MSFMYNDLITTLDINKPRMISFSISFPEIVYHKTLYFSLNSWQSY